MMDGEIAGGGPHDGARIQVPADCIAIAVISENPDGEYVASFSVRRSVDIVEVRLADCLIQLASNRLQR
jgi:hypothetical protein